MAMRWIWAGVALAGLSACGSDVEEGLTFAELVEANADMAERVVDLPNTRAADMPVTGSAEFEGYAALTMDTERRTDLVGTATLTADFEDETIGGSMQDFRGRVRGSAVQEMDGALTLSDGAIGLLTASDFAADVDGKLTGQDTGAVLGVDGSVIGNFRGDGAQALTAVSGRGTDFTVNGTERGGLLSIVAER